MTSPTQWLRGRKGQCRTEAKSSERIAAQHLKGLRALVVDHRKVERRLVVCRERRARTTEDGIEIVPVHQFVKRLWSSGLTA